MPESFDLVIRNGRLFTPSGPVEADLGAREGRIAALGDLAAAPTAETFDARGLEVLPGAIDTQVHLREPGNEHKEDLETGTKAALLGGVVAVFEMPNTRPSTTTQALLEDKFKRARGRAWVDHAFFIGAAHENAMELARLEALPGCAGVKMFMGSSTGTLLVADDAGVLDVLRHGRRRVAVHAEDEARLIERRSIALESGRPHAHPEWRDEETALRAVKRLLALARRAGRRVHVLHVTSAGEMAELARHKDIATVETTPQHLTFAAPECYDRLGTYAQMNPPIRDARHREALWRAVADGVVDVIGSDHAPHTREEKARPYPESPSGMPGVQTLVPILLDHVNAGRLTLARFVDLTAAGPARIYNIAAKGRIALGYDADFTIVDLKARRRIENRWIASRCGWTPFDGMEVTGWPRATVIRGRVAMRDDEALGAPGGIPVRFQETLPAER
ncbi:MAG TPA: dihydroorotase [Alphaproteobacteria bacterium]|nr:dihydroorotase [Alphaproteobacteria bacterium]